ncbi:hypothetical protein ACFFQW_20475 [Umezawaea endophytica]|uniref:Uncharacterized protein n=1 Tax=Umezawaea endophytica TaxID=1654476 RepID=A0A9X3A405_9PSEU|nr:hypothetical protein [Umezawaea endophytica]MCS7482309.1 hypothetical protein [Umezawaea endophytica]
MTSEAFARFRADLAAAVTRGRRAASDAGVRNDAARARTRELAQRAREKKAEPGVPATSPDVRRVAGGFREERGLPVEEFPETGETFAPEKTTDANANTPPTTPSSRPAPGPRGQLPRRSDDDEDFSQGQILY